MGFKSDREFLRNISIGAIGTRQVAAILARGGFQIIELERYCSSNKIWATKIKRLRVADLLCLKTGIRIESKGKSKLEITMSHAVNNPDRAWDQGLRDDDFIAFIKCSSDDDSWVPSERLALFRVGDMRSKAADAGLSRMKSAAEGSEIRLTWPATVPGSPGKVTAVSDEKIETQLTSGRKQTYQLLRKNKSPLVAYVQAGDEFGAGDSVIASVMPAIIPITVPNRPHYDFTRDLRSPSNEDVYVAVKALGHLPEDSARCMAQLIDIAKNHEDSRIRLEAAASLARLGNTDAWSHLEALATDTTVDAAYRMETAFILAELPGQRARQLLSAVANSTANASELRAAAAWGLSTSTGNLSSLLPLTRDSDEMTAVHAIVAASRLIDRSTVGSVLNEIGADDRQAAGLVRTVLSSKCDFLPELAQQLQNAPAGRRRQWLLYLFAAAGQPRGEAFANQLSSEMRAELDFYWNHHASNWTNRLDVADQINFLEQQTT